MASQENVIKERDKKKGIAELIEAIADIKRIEGTLSRLSTEFPEISAHTDSLSTCLVCLDSRIEKIMTEHSRALTQLRVSDDFTPNEKIVKSEDTDFLRRRHTVPTNFKIRIYGKTA